MFVYMQVNHVLFYLKSTSSQNNMIYMYVFFLQFDILP